MANVKLIFGRSSKVIGLLIRFLDISPWSHVGIYDEENGVVYESVGVRYKGRLGRRKGVICTDIKDFKKRYSAWRVKEVWTGNDGWREQCEMLVSNKTDYDFSAVLGGIWFVRLLRIKLGCKHALHCAEFVNVVCRRFIADYSPTVADLWRLNR
jgi:hypothetical protein